IGDRILIPYYNQIRLATVTGELSYSEVDRTSDLANQRKVSYYSKDNKIVNIPRSALSEGLQRRMRVQGTCVGNLADFAEEMSKLFQGITFDMDFEDLYNKQIETLEVELLENITNGKTNLAAGGYGLEKLVQELLVIDGYTASILSKQKFDGFADADIEAIRLNRFGEETLLVQVKHHQGHSDTWGAEQLIQILKTDSFKENMFKLVLVTTAKASEGLIDLCENKDIQLFDGESFVKWLVESIPKLKRETKRALGLSDVATLLNV
ncbi:restriction endonuclease, partial [bacterium]|nr:restriction endonuclease [bacterium]